MFRGVVLLVCILVAQSLATDVEGIPTKVCGNQTFSTTYQTANPVTFVVTSSNPKVVVSPATVTYTSTSVVPITVSCNALGAAEITFQQSGTNGARDSVYLYCYGLLNVANPISTIHRGNTFELILELYPTPVQRVEVLIDSLSPLVIPGAERAVFGIEQDVANAIFYVPAGGDVGTAEIIFRSRSLRDYIGPNCEDLIVRVDVQGEISAVVPEELGKQNSYTVTVEISPTPLVPTEISISSPSIVGPSSIIFPVGQNTQEFTFTVNAEAGDQACINFSGTYYQTSTSCFTVLGSIFSDLTSEINTYAVESFHVTLAPGAPAGGVTVYLTSSPNLQLPSQLFFAEGVTQESFQVVGVDDLVGAGYVEFTAEGYAPLRVDLQVIQVECEGDSTISRDGTHCLPCPTAGSLGYTCSFVGECVYSSFAYESARCICNEGYYGPECQFSDFYYSPAVLITPFDYPGTVVIDRDLPLVLSASFSIPPGLVQDGVNGEGTLYISPIDAVDQAYFSYYVDPTYYAPEIDGDVVTPIATGFSITVAASDNTALNVFRPPIQSRFTFHPLKISQRDFLELSLYYYDESASEWVTSMSVCSAQYRFVNRDLLALSYSTNLCRAGQYQFYVVEPEPYHRVEVDPQPDDAVYFEKYFIADLYMTGTGLGGELPPLPPQPVFRETVVEEAILDPGKLAPPKDFYLYQSTSPSSVLLVSLTTLLAALLIVL